MALSYAGRLEMLQIVYVHAVVLVRDVVDGHVWGGHAPFGVGQIHALAERGVGVLVIHPKDVAVHLLGVIEARDGFARGLFANAVRRHETTVGRHDSHARFPYLVVHVVGHQAKEGGVVIDVVD